MKLRKLPYAWITPAGTSRCSILSAHLLANCSVRRQPEPNELPAEAIKNTDFPHRAWLGVCPDRSFPEILGAPAMLLEQVACLASKREELQMQMKKRKHLWVLAFMGANYGAHSQTPPSQIVVPRPDIEAVVQAMSTKTCEGIVTGKQKQVAAETNIKLLYKDKPVPYPLSADDVAQILVMMHCT